MDVIGRPAYCQGQKIMAFLKSGKIEENDRLIVTDNRCRASRLTKHGTTRLYQVFERRIGFSWCVAMKRTDDRA